MATATMANVVCDSVAMIPSQIVVCSFDCRCGRWYCVGRCCGDYPSAHCVRLVITSTALNRGGCSLAGSHTLAAVGVVPLYCFNIGRLRH